MHSFDGFIYNLIYPLRWTHNTAGAFVGHGRGWLMNLHTTPRQYHLHVRSTPLLKYIKTPAASCASTDNGCRPTPNASGDPARCTCGWPWGGTACHAGRSCSAGLCDRYTTHHRCPGRSDTLYKALRRHRRTVPNLGHRRTVPNLGHRRTAQSSGRRAFLPSLPWRRHCRGCPGLPRETEAAT
jgi:hypothetical protein